jgi:hypothetical protein
MNLRNTRSLTRHIALGSGLVMLFAGCQLAAPVKPNLGAEGTVTGATRGTVVKPGQAGAGATGANGAAGATGENGTGTGANVPVVADAKVQGQVLDMAGKGVAGVEINTYNGFRAVSDAEGKFTIDAVGEEQLRLDFSKDGFLGRQIVTGVAAGMGATVSVTLKSLDGKVTSVDAEKGGTVTNTDGSSILEIPAGALMGDTKVRLTWMDPIPSEQFPTSFGELPGQLVTQTQPQGDKPGQSYVLPPLAFTNVEWVGARLAPGAQAILKMKVNPEAVKRAGTNIDFNNPATLQQPCYDYDRATGLWINPALSKLEKDANGDVWFIYTLRGADAPTNYKLLQTVSEGGFVTGKKTIRWTEQEARTGSTQRWEENPGGGGRWVTDYFTYYETVQKSRIEDLYGKYLSGKVTEKSANKALDGKGLDNATVYHNADWFSGTTKRTGGAGGFSIPVAHNVSGIGVNGASYKGANSAGGGWNMTINTDGHVKANIQGGSLAFSATNSNLTGGSWTGAVDQVASRESNVTLKAPAAPLYIVGSPKLTGEVPVKGTLDFGLLKVVRDLAGQVVEIVTASPDNAKTPHQNSGDGLDGVVVTGLTDSATGETSKTSADGGKFKFALFGDKAAPASLHGDFKGFVAGDGPMTKIPVNTDSHYTLTLSGTFGSENVGQTATVTYTVDRIEYTKQVVMAADGTIKFVFARDKTDNKLDFAVKKVETVNMIAVAPFPNADLTPGGTEQGTAKLVYKDSAIK